jgi:hypothetical protein
VDRGYLNSFTPLKLALYSAKNVELEHEKAAAWEHLNIYAT